MARIVLVRGNKVEEIGPDSFFALHLHGPHAPGLKGALSVDTYRSPVVAETGVFTPVQLLDEQGKVVGEVRVKTVQISPGHGARFISLAGDVEVWA